MEGIVIGRNGFGAGLGLLAFAFAGTAFIVTVGAVVVPPAAAASRDIANLDAALRSATFRA